MHQIARVHISIVICNICCKTRFIRTGWRRVIGCLIFICHFSQKNPKISGSFYRSLFIGLFLVFTSPVHTSLFVCAALFDRSLFIGLFLQVSFLYSYVLFRYPSLYRSLFGIYKSRSYIPLCICCSVLLNSPPPPSLYQLLLTVPAGTDCDTDA